MDSCYVITYHLLGMDKIQSKGSEAVTVRLLPSRGEGGWRRLWLWLLSPPVERNSYDKMNVDSSSVSEVAADFSDE